MEALLKRHFLKKIKEVLHPLKVGLRVSCQRSVSLERWEVSTFPQGSFVWWLSGSPLSVAPPRGEIRGSEPSGHGALRQKLRARERDRRLVGLLGPSGANSDPEIR